MKQYLVFLICLLQLSNLSGAADDKPELVGNLSELKTSLDQLEVIVETPSMSLVSMHGAEKSHFSRAVATINDVKISLVFKNFNQQRADALLLFITPELRVRNEMVRNIILQAGPEVGHQFLQAYLSMSTDPLVLPAGNLSVYGYKNLIFIPVQAVVSKVSDLRRQVEKLAASVFDAVRVAIKKNARSIVLVETPPQSEKIEKVAAEGFKYGKNRRRELRKITLVESDAGLIAEYKAVRVKTLIKDVLGGLVKRFDTTVFDSITVVITDDRDFFLDCVTELEHIAGLVQFFDDKVAVRFNKEVVGRKFNKLAHSSDDPKHPLSSATLKKIETYKHTLDAPEKPLAESLKQWQYRSGISKTCDTIYKEILKLSEDTFEQQLLLDRTFLIPEPFNDLDQLFVSVRLLINLAALVSDDTLFDGLETEWEQIFNAFQEWDRFDEVGEVIKQFSSALPGSKEQQQIIKRAEIIKRDRFYQRLKEEQLQKITGELVTFFIKQFNDPGRFTLQERITLLKNLEVLKNAAVDFGSLAAAYGAMRQAVLTNKLAKLKLELKNRKRSSKFKTYHDGLINQLLSNYFLNVGTITLDQIKFLQVI